MISSKVVTVAFGSLTVLAALLFNSMQDLSLFDLMLQFTALVTMPVAVPLLWGMFYKRTPSWSGWSTVLVCLAASLVIGNLPALLGPDAYQHLLRLDTPLAGWEKSDAIFALGVLTNAIVGSAWFFGTGFWYGRQAPAFHDRVESFFDKMRTPIDFQKEHGANADQSQLRTLGLLCLTYGGFIATLIFIPNPLSGRLCFLAIGSIIGGIGLLLFRASRRAS